MFTLYGIPNCGTVKKARACLEAQGAEYRFHDFRKDGVDAALIGEWLRQVGWQKLLKKTGPTWAQLPETVKASIQDDASALALMLEKPNVIKRPVLVEDGKVLATGFNETEYERLFN